MKKYNSLPDTSPLVKVPPRSFAHFISDSCVEQCLLRVTRIQARFRLMPGFYVRLSCSLCVVMAGIKNIKM